MVPQSHPPSEPTTTATSKLPFRPRKSRKLSENSTPETPTAATPDASAAIQPFQAPPRPLRFISAPAPLTSDGEIAAALRHLRSSDPLLGRLIDTLHPPTFESYLPPFLALSKSILYQQLAVKAGASIYTRFLALCGGDSAVLPHTVLALTPHQLRQIGVSARKASYLHDLANKYCTGILSDGLILGMDDRSLFTMLTMVKGIGAWSVHMFMIFSLHRPDVLPVGDVGVRKGVQLLYGLGELPRPSQMEQLCEKWRPYRSVGAWYMWRLSEGKPAAANSNANTGSLGIDGGAGVQQESQILDPISGIAGIGACTWGQ